MKTRLCLALTVLLVLTVAGCGPASRGIAPVRTASAPVAPEFTLPTLAGPPLALSDLRGKVVLLNFWATWCSACLVEMPLLETVSKEESSWAVVLGVNVGERPDMVKRYMRDFNLTFPVVLDGDGRVAASYGIWAYPTTFFIDRDGIVRDGKVGAFQSEEELKAKLDRLR